MVPAPSHPTWAKLIRGEVQHKFKAAAAGMLFFNLQSLYKKDPTTLRVQVEEARKFFGRYEAILTEDVRVLFT
jgi:hypothetical protein